MSDPAIASSCTAPVLVSQIREDFEKAQEKLKNISENAFSQPKATRNDTLFRQKLICAMCGKKMYCNSTKGKLYFQCQAYQKYDSCTSNYITENDLKRVVLDYLHRLYLAVKSDRNAVISKLGLDTITEIEDQIRTAENRADEISHLLIEIYEKKFQNIITDSEFKSRSEALSREKNDLLHFLADLTAKKSIRSKEKGSVIKMLDKISSYSESDFDVLTQEMVNALIEKIVIGKPMGQREKNYGKRMIDIYIYELGNLSELIDVRFKPYSVRIKEIAPQLLLERRCDTANVIEALATKRGSLENALAEEGTNFQTVIVEVRKKILIDAIRNGLTIKEIYPLLGYPEPSNVYWFSKRFLGMRFNDLNNMVKTDD